LEENKMKKTTKKAVKALIRDGKAIDITNASMEKCYELEKYLDTVALGHGIYGMNCGLFEDRRDGKLYGITCRSGNLFVLV